MSRVESVKDLEGEMGYEGGAEASGATALAEMDGGGDRWLEPITPGEMLFEEFMEPLGLTKYRLAKAIHVPQTRIGEIIAGKRRITADTDLRLCRYFGLSEGYWQRLQVLYDTRIARRRLEEELATIEPHPVSEVEEGVLASADELPERMTTSRNDYWSGIREATSCSMHSSHATSTSS